jgi:hypothetical protein
MKRTGPWKRTRRGMQVEALAVAALLSAAADAECQLLRLAELPTAGDRPLVAVSLDGHPAGMLVDTGSYESFIWRSVAASLHLDQTSSDVHAIWGAGGRTSTGLTTVHEFAVGGYAVRNLTMSTLGERESEPAASDSGVVAGILGEDFLYRMDVEFDLASGKIRLFEPKGCSGDQVVYWASAYNMVPLLPDRGGHSPLARVVLNGHEVVALFDTGSGRSTVLAEVTKRPGMSPEAQTGSSGTGHGIGPRAVEFSIARFTSLTVGQETIRNPTLAIADLMAANRTETLGSHISQRPEPFDLILGMDFFRAHRIYITRGQGRVYFTYSGGAIFQPPAAQQN